MKSPKQHKIRYIKNIKKTIHNKEKKLKRDKIIKDFLSFLAIPDILCFLIGIPILGIFLFFNYIYNFFS